MKKVKTAVLVIMAAVCIFNITASAETKTRAGGLQSRGRIEHSNGKVILDSADLVYLADEINMLEQTYKTGIIEAGNEVGCNLSLEKNYEFGELTEAIRNSQAITGSYDTETEDEEGNVVTDTTPLIGAAAANLPLGTAAWVEGHYIVGTGEDLAHALERAVEEVKTQVQEKAGLIGTYSTRCWNSTSTCGKQTLQPGTYCLKYWVTINDGYGDGSTHSSRLYINGKSSEDGTYTFTEPTEVYAWGTASSRNMTLSFIIVQIM